MNYYNEFDPAAAQWLRNLIAAGLIPAGDVDERSIEDVRPSDLAGYTQCHFFAGIGGWPEALRLAGVPDDAPLWTGSCPCQPYSAAGKGGGSDDPRNLWWAFRWLIDQCRPAAVLGEQVASKAGRGWLAGVRADLEALGYAVGAADLCAASAGSPHIRQRLYWMADTDDTGPQGRVEHRDGTGQRPAWSRGLAIGCADGKVRRVPESVFLGLADGLSDGVGGLSPREGYPLAQGVEGRVTALKGIGNAIVPQVAAEFITSWREARCHY